MFSLLHLLPAALAPRGADRRLVGAQHRAAARGGPLARAPGPDLHPLLRRQAPSRAAAAPAPRPRAPAPDGDGGRDDPAGVDRARRGQAAAADAGAPGLGPDVPGGRHPPATRSVWELLASYLTGADCTMAMPPPRHQLFDHDRLCSRHTTPQAPPPPSPARSSRSPARPLRRRPGSWSCRGWPPTWSWRRSTPSSTTRGKAGPAGPPSPCTAPRWAGTACWAAAASSWTCGTRARCRSCPSTARA